MRVRAFGWIGGLVAASAAVSAVALGEGGPAPRPAVASPGPAGNPKSAASAGDAGTARAAGPERALSTWGTGPGVTPSMPSAEDEEEDDDEDAGAPAAAADAGAPEAADASAAAAGPSTVGLAIGIHAPGYAIPFGNENGSSMHDYIVTGMIPIGIDAGWFFTPHLYAGAYFTYGFGLTAGLKNDPCGSADDCSATIVQVGLAAHWHFRPEATLDPWVGVGLGYEEIVFNATSTADGSTDFSHGSPAILGSLQAGLDLKPLSYLGVGPYAELSGGTFVVTDSGLHGWATFGVRFRTNL